MDEFIGRFALKSSLSGGALIGGALVEPLLGPRRAPVIDIPFPSRLLRRESRASPRGNSERALVFHLLRLVPVGLDLFRLVPVGLDLLRLVPAGLFRFRCFLQQLPRPVVVCGIGLSGSRYARACHAQAKSFASEDQMAFRTSFAGDLI